MGKEGCRRRDGSTLTHLDLGCKWNNWGMVKLGALLGFTSEANWCIPYGAIFFPEGMGEVYDKLWNIHLGSVCVAP